MADAKDFSLIDDPSSHLALTDSLSTTCALRTDDRAEIEETAPSVQSNLSEWEQDFEDYSDDNSLADGAYHRAFSSSPSGLSRLLVSTEQPVYTHPLESSVARENNILEDDGDDDDDDDDDEGLDEKSSMESDLDTDDYRSQDSPHEFPSNQLIEPNQVRALMDIFPPQVDERSSGEVISEHRLLELQSRRLASEHRRKLLARVPAGGRNGKQWKASDLPLKIIRQIIHLVAISIVTEEVQAKLADGDNRIHFGKRPVGLTIAHIRARSRIAPLRLVCRAWKQATETIPFWSELATVFGFPHNIRPYRENDCLITQLCWVCHFARFPLSQPAAYVRTTLGTVWICKLHLAVPFCGRCLRSRIDPAFRSRRLQWIGPRSSLPEYTAPNEDIDPGLRLTEDDDVEDEDDDINGGVNAGRELYGPNMACCQRCRYECLQEAVTKRDPAVRIDLEDNGDLECFFQYVERAQGSAESIAVDLLERRWLARWTKFHDLATQVVQTEKINPVTAASADGNDMRAIFKASMGIEGDGSEPMTEALERELAQFEYEAAVAREENAARVIGAEHNNSDGERQTDEEGQGQEDEEEEEEEEEEEGVELTPGGYIQIVEMATEAWIHQRVIDGFWVSPLEQRAFQETFSQQTPSSAEGDITLDVVHPLSSSTLGSSVCTTSSHPNGPLPPAGGALDQKTINLYSRKLRSILLPGLGQIARLCALQKDPLNVAPKLGIHKLLELLRLPGAWVHGGLDCMELALDQADGPEQISTMPAEILSPPPLIRHPNNISPSESLSFMPTSSTAKMYTIESPSSTDSISPSAPSSHTTSPIRTGSSPPTSLSPPSCAPTIALITPDPPIVSSTLSSVPSPKPNPAQNMKKIDPRFPLSPKTSRPVPQIPRVPLDASRLGLYTKDIIKRAWWDACDDMRRCVCSICLRGLKAQREGRQDEGIVSDREPKDENDEMQEEQEERGKRKGGNEDSRAGDKKQRIEVDD